MGLFAFMKTAGEALANALQLGDAKAPAAVQSAIAQHNLGVEDIQVSIVGDKVVLKGKAATPEAAEKAILVAGNIKGVAAVEADIAVPGSAPAAQFYTVQAGDTLSKIAKKHYGDANRYQAIFDANRPMLTHPDKIYPGQSLRIPQAENKNAAA
ncbi:MAG: peptidoglycan-binding protein LysM [Alphaproteobacteria bacterium]